MTPLLFGARIRSKPLEAQPDILAIGFGLVGLEIDAGRHAHRLAGAIVEGAGMLGAFDLEVHHQAVGEMDRLVRAEPVGAEDAVIRAER